MAHLTTLVGPWPRAMAILLGAGLIAGLPLPLLAQSAAPSRGDVEKQLRAQQEGLRAADTRAVSISGDIAAMEAQREALTRQLVEAAELEKKSEARLTELEAKLAPLEAQEKVIEEDFAARRSELAQLLGALVRMGRNPPPVIVTGRADILSMVRSAKLLSRLYPDLKTKADALEARLKELDAVRATVAGERDKLRQETARLSTARAEVASLIETKKRTLGERQAELEAARKAAGEIAKSVASLNELIAALDKAPPPPPAAPQPAIVATAEPPAPAAPAAPSFAESAASALSKAPADPSAPAAGGAPAPAPTAPPAIKPPARLALATSPPPVKPTTIVVEPRGDTTPGSFGRLYPQAPFVETKGRLPMPAEGRRLLSFGEKRQSVGDTPRSVLLETRFGARVTSPCDGWVVFAHPFRSYGQLLIINASDKNATDQYRIVLSGLSQLLVEDGQFVVAGEPVGTMPERPANAKVAAQPPQLTIEFRLNNKSIDPEPWWVVSEKVRG